MITRGRKAHLYEMVLLLEEGKDPNLDHLTTEEYAFVYEEIRGKEPKFTVGYNEKEDSDGTYSPMTESDESEDTSLFDDDYTEDHKDSESEDSESEDTEGEDSWELATGSDTVSYDTSEDSDFDPYEPPPMPTYHEVPQEIKTFYRRNNSRSCR